MSANELASLLETTTPGDTQRPTTAMEPLLLAHYTSSIMPAQPEPDADVVTRSLRAGRATWLILVVSSVVGLAAGTCAALLM